LPAKKQDETEQMGMRLTCKQASRLLSEDMDGRLGFGRRLALRLHLLACDACTRVKAQMAFLRRAMAEFPAMTPDGSHNHGSRDDH
jgi:hypothetical protein